MALNLLDLEAWCLADLGHRPATVKKVVGRVRQLASVSRRMGFPVTFQRFRHWRARYLLKQGVGLRVIQELMGHSDPKTTAWYAGVDLETMHGELARCHVPGFTSLGVSGSTLEGLA